MPQIYIFKSHDEKNKAPLIKCYNKPHWAHIRVTKQHPLPTDGPGDKAPWEQQTDNGKTLNE